MSESDRTLPSQKGGIIRTPLSPGHKQLSVKPMEKASAIGPYTGMMGGDSNAPPPQPDVRKPKNYPHGEFKVKGA